MTEYLLELKDIRKQFGENLVLNGVNLGIKPGEIHALIGKNGAGKTTLMKILNGVIAKDSGSILWDGQEIEITSVKQAQSLGISMVYQDLNLFPHLTVGENIFIDYYKQRHLEKFGVMNKERVYQQAQNILDSLHFPIDARKKIYELSFAEQQMVEIGRAISRQAKLLILDEPTAALNEQEVQCFFRVLEKIRLAGASVIYISHRLKEIKQIAQVVTIIRDGCTVSYGTVNDLEGEELIKLMVGEEALGRYPRLALPAKRELLRVENLSMGNVLTDISFRLRESEILGITGLAGSGRTALINAIFGAGVSVTGRILLRGREIRLKSPREAIKLGLAYLAEDRLRSGLFSNLSFKQNVSSSDLHRVSKRGIINRFMEQQVAQGLAKRLGIIIQNLQQHVSVLSGGNQQKTVLAKWLFSGGYIYLLDEPTNGLDIASKVDIYNIMNSLVCGGSGIIMISSDFAELMGMCHRVIVIYKGQIAGELQGEEISEENIVKLASGRE